MLARSLGRDSTSAGGPDFRLRLVAVVRCNRRRGPLQNALRPFFFLLVTGAVQPRTRRCREITDVWPMKTRIRFKIVR